MFVLVLVLVLVLVIVIDPLTLRLPHSAFQIPNSAFGGFRWP